MVTGVSTLHPVPDLSFKRSIKACMLILSFIDEVDETGQIHRYYCAALGSRTQCSKGNEKRKKKYLLGMQEKH